MESFVQRRAAHVTGVLHGFDRLRLRGTQRLLAHAGGMLDFLRPERVLLKHFAACVETTTRLIRDATRAIASAARQAVRQVSRRTLNPLSSEDARWLEAVNRGEFTLNGFRNRDLRTLLHGSRPAEKQEHRRQSAADTEKLLAAA